jgi:hypothetical protein
MKRKLELYKEYPERNEAALTKKLIPLLIQLIKESYLTGTTYRDTHAKGHLVVRGEFTVGANLPRDLRVGLFRKPATYPCWIRFANTSPNPQADKRGDVRSMSLKLMDVEGEMLWQDEEDAGTLDITMMGSKTFLAPNLAQFYDMEVALYQGGLSMAWFFLTHPRIAWTVATGFTKCANLLEVPYHSQTAYLFGDRAVQYHIKSHQPKVSKIPRHAPSNFLRERLVEYLATDEALFDFQVQFQTDAEKMPIENPMVAWDENLSPYVKVATIRIPSQETDSPALVAFCENIAFNPWRTLPEHRPLGGINRVRREVYPMISQFRHHRNSAPIKEPRSDGSYPDLTTDDGYVEPNGHRVPEPSRLHRLLPIIGLVVLALLLVVGGILAYRYYRRIRPPVITDNLFLNDTGDKVLTEDERQRYYHLSQGSQIMPYAWFVSLEQTLSQEPWMAPDHIAQFRLLPDPNTNGNPDRLPLGWAKDDPDPVTGVVNVGLTCAACHTAQMTYKGRGIHINGAPGMVDFNGFLLHLVLTLQFNVNDAGKFDRFSHRVLGSNYSSEAARSLKEDVLKYVDQQLSNQFFLRLNDFRLGLNATKPGFGRIDALGSGGNRLYGILDPKNNRTLNAPVKILPLWYAPQYNWVQTNGSIRQPVARNIIESLAVNSSVVFGSQFPKSDWYTSSARLHNMWELEETLSKFKAPVWPEDILGKIDQEAAKRGEMHYQKYCASCHEPQRENRPEPGDDVATRNNKTYFVLRLFPVDKVGTDPIDAQNFARRTLDASSITNDLPQQYQSQAKNLPGSVIIGMVLQGIIDKQYGTMTDQQRDPLIGYRQNLLRACEAYPARPLAGIWAAPPYLHNGSVRNLYQLLLPSAEREKSFCTGQIEYDPVNVGYVTLDRCEFPWFRFNTQSTGNSNAGHNYGTSLSQNERMDLIEYLKVIKFPDQGYPLIDPQADCPK